MLWVCNNLPLHSLSP